MKNIRGVWLPIEDGRNGLTFVQVTDQHSVAEAVNATKGYASTLWKQLTGLRNREQTSTFLNKHD